MPTLTRRRFVSGTGAASAVVAGGLSPLPLARAAGPELSAALPEGVRSSAVLDALPGKKPLIKLSYRPPNYETPIEYFRQPITPNNAFFVRYHLAFIPSVDATTWKISIGGDGANGQAQLTLEDLKAMPPAEVVAVNQCSGNRRGLFQPHVPGVEWGYGAMGCARWKGARLKDVLDKVGLKKEAVEMAFSGADGPVVDKTPPFVKSIPVWKAMEESTLIAYEMNGEALPHLNGYPLPPGRAWLDRHLLDETPRLDQSTDQAGVQFLDEHCLSHSPRQVPASGALYLAGHSRQYADHGDDGQLAHHQPWRWCRGEGRQCAWRHCLGWRLRHSHR